MKSIQCKVRVTIPASPLEVFQALTVPSKIRAWSGGQTGKVEARVGGRFEFFDGWVKGSVLAYHRGKRLSYTWLPADWPKETQASVVVYTFLPSAGGTTILLTHSGFPNAREMRSHKSGWKEFVFDPLKQYFAT